MKSKYQRAWVMWVSAEFPPLKHDARGLVAGLVTHPPARLYSLRDRPLRVSSSLQAMAMAAGLPRGDYSSRHHVA
jgi:hypothetical protein